MERKSTLLILLSLMISLKSQGQQVYSTKNCKNYDHPEIEFVVTNKSIPINDIEWIISTLEDVVSNGTKYKNDQTLQLGYTIVKFIQKNNGVLEILEPDFVSFPINFINKLDNTLIYLRSQKDIVESVKEETDLFYPSILESIVVHKNYISADKVLLERTEIESSISGWWVYDYNDQEGVNDTSNFSNISLYEFALKRPDLVKFLALAVGFQVLSSVEGVSLYTGNQPVDIKVDSYLNQLNKEK